MSAQRKVTLPDSTELKTWHSKDDFHLRKGMIYIMMKLFESITETYLETSKQKLLKNIELSLYVDASSIEEYADMSTLKKRMMVQVMMKQQMEVNAKKNMSQVY